MFEPIKTFKKSSSHDNIYVGNNSVLYQTNDEISVLPISNCECGHCKMVKIPGINNRITLDSLLESTSKIKKPKLPKQPKLPNTKIKNLNDDNLRKSNHFYDKSTIYDYDYIANERWKPMFPNNPEDGREISNLGRCRHTTKQSTTTTKKLYKTYVDCNGDRYINVSVNNRIERFFIAELMLEAFNHKRPSEYHKARFKDKNKRSIKLENIEWYNTREILGIPKQKSKKQIIKTPKPEKTLVKTIKGHYNWKIDNYGNVYDPMGSRIKPIYINNVWCVYVDNKRYSIMELVATAFCKKYPNQHKIMTRDGDRNHYYSTNLYWE